MPTNTYQIGTGVRLSVLFQTLAYTPTDPTTIQLRTQKPSGAITVLVYGTDAAVIRDSAGAYHADVIPASNAEAGDWYYRWEGTGALQAAEQGTFNVQASPFF